MSNSSVYTHRNHCGEPLVLSKPPEGLLYYTPKVGLYRFLKELPKIIEGESIRFIVIDSLGASCVDPDKVIEVIEVLTELKNLGVTSLVLDHQPKLQSNDSYDSKTPYGSVYKFNLSRSVFQLSSLTDSINPLQLQLSHTKSNFGRRSDALRFEIHFEGDRVLFTESKAPSKDEKDMRLIHEAMVELEGKGGKGKSEKSHTTPYIYNQGFRVLENEGLGEIPEVIR